MRDAPPQADPAAGRGRRPGAHLEGDGVRFTVFSRSARRLWLMLFDRPEDERPHTEIELDPAQHREGYFWSLHVPGVRTGTLYLYRADAPERGLTPDHWLMDPCATAVETGRRWGERDGFQPGPGLRAGRAFPKCAVADDAFDWHDDHFPRLPLRDLVIYECHVRGFTAHASAGVAAPGTYRGMMEKIPHLQRLGITAVEFLPLHEFNEMEFYLEDMGRRHLLNFWGYSPLAFFAPMGRYAADGSGLTAARELRELIRALHAAGIEVILDVVFNHTGEGGPDGPVYSFKGFGEAVYYRVRPDGTYDNFSGCGNTINAADPVVQQMVVDCLRHWREAYHVDGFRFDLASALTRGPDGQPVEHPPLLHLVDAEPALAGVKFFAEPWDAKGLYQVGSFPHPRWAEWNGLFRDDVRRFWNGQGGTAGRLATRLAGSSDLYAAGRTPFHGVNLITTHDGFTLADLVRYRQRHNQANGENNHDGERHNFSENYGIEGPSTDPGLEAFRLRQQKNLLATLLVSQGIPLILGGDEFGRTQQGNNNAYAQDNEISWVDWTLLEKNRELFEFVRTLLAFRRRHGSLRRGRFLSGRPGAPGLAPDIEWIGPDGGAPDWDHGHALAFRLDGAPANTGLTHPEPDLFILFNGSTTPVRFIAPATTANTWQQAWSTTDLPAQAAPGDFIEMPALAAAAYAGEHGAWQAP